MCKEFIKFELQNGGIIVQARDEIERISTGDECYLLHLFPTAHRRWKPVKLTLTEKNLKTIRSLTEKYICCCCKNNSESS